MKTERELYALELGGFGVIDAVFNDIDECIGFSCFSYCGLTKDDITFGYRIWLASKNREGYKLVPVELVDEIEDKIWDNLSANHTITNQEGDGFIPVEDIDLGGIYKAMIGASE